MSCTTAKKVETQQIKNSFISHNWKKIEAMCDKQDQEFLEKDAYWLQKKYKTKIYIEPSNCEHLFLYGRLLGLLNKPHEAMSYFYGALVLDSEYIWALYSIGILHLKSKTYVQAQVFFQKCVNINSEFIPALIALAKLKVKKEYVAALELLQYAEELSPQDIHTKQHIADVLTLGKRYDEALAKYHEMHQISKQDTTILSNWSKLLIKLKQYDLALQILKKLYVLLPNDQKNALEKTILLVMKLQNSKFPK